VFETSSAKKSPAVGALTPAEWSLIAPNIAYHFKPLPSGEAPTDAAFYKARIQRKLPRTGIPEGCLFADIRSDGKLGLVRVKK